MLHATTRAAMLLLRHGQETVLATPQPQHGRSEAGFLVSSRAAHLWKRRKRHRRPHEPTPNNTTPKTRSQPLTSKFCPCTPLLSKNCYGNLDGWQVTAPEFLWSSDTHSKLGVVPRPLQGPPSLPRPQPRAIVAAGANFDERSRTDFPATLPYRCSQTHVQLHF